MRKLLKYSAVFTVFLAFHAHAADVTVDKNVVRDISENFCIEYIGTGNRVGVIFPTQQGLGYVGTVTSGNPTNCNNLFNLASEFQDPENIPWGAGLEVIVGDLDINPNFENECVTTGQADGCQETVAGVLDRYKILGLRQSNSILGAQSSSDYVAALAESTGNTVDDFYPIAAAALGLIVAFALLGYIIATFPDNTKELEKVKKLSREVDEHIDRTTESYKAWNRRLGNLFRE